MRSADVVPAMREVLTSGISDGVAPGMACAVGNGSETWFVHEGRHTYDPDSTEICEHSLWDLASVSKIAGTTSVALSLFQEGLLDLDAHVPSILPGFEGEMKDDVTVRNLLLHDSGLPAYRNFLKYTDAVEVKAELFKTELACEPGSKYAYSCLGFVTLMELMARITGKPLDEMLAERVTGPLGMENTMFNPVAADRSRCAQTEKQEGWRMKVEDLRKYERLQDDFVQGNVHDPIAFLIGGVSGNAGLFSNVTDLSKLARAWMTDSGPFTSESMELFTQRHNEDSARGFGFEMKSAEDSSSGDKFSMSSFGHTGFTGPCVWIDPEAQVFAVHLCNRVHPTSANIKIRKFRPKFFSMAHELMASI